MSETTSAQMEKCRRVMAWAAVVLWMLGASVVAALAGGELPEDIRSSSTGVLTFHVAEIPVLLEHGVENNILDLGKIYEISIGIPLHEWHAGDKNKIWIDEVMFYQKDDFEPTVYEGETAVNRQK